MSKSPSLRRIQADIRELLLDPSDRYHAAPLDNDMFEWHFTIRGADDTDFAGGVYHGRIMLPPEYPFKPPHIIFLTPSGRFETNTKVCLSFSAYHPELWQPAWGIRLILEALISFLPTPADGAIGALDWTSAERRKLAAKSVDYSCPTCGCKAIDLLPKPKPKCQAAGDGSDNTDKPKSRFQKEIEKLQQLQSAQHGKKEEPDTTTTETDSLLTEEEKEISEDNNDTDQEQPKVEEALAKAETPDPEPVETAPVSSATPQPTSQEEDAAPAEIPAVQEELPAPQVALPPEDGVLSWMVDPVLHGIILLLAVLCVLLMRKLQAMMEELDELNQVLKS